MKAEEVIFLLQNENSKMREKLEFANRELSTLFNALDRGDEIDVKEVVAYIGINIKSFLDERS